MRRFLLPTVLAACGLAAVAVAEPQAAKTADQPPPVRREFRGVWVATVGNIDWPSRKGLPTRQQQEEMRAILDKCVELKLNAVVFQVRPMADALYASDLEPWSEFLSGKLGQAPDPFYDPLEYAVREAHARGLELHAWLNPYRAKVPAATSAVPDTHLVKKRPDLAKPYGKHFWLNPTHPEVQERSLKVFLDVVRRYDVDGVHMDDYFYPYPEPDADKKDIPFPDDDTWAAYQKAGGTLSQDDWRRDAVNRFVERLYKEVKATKPWVKVGISPFGIWRPGHPPGIEGFDQYGKLYADAKLWLNEGWVDYFTPQLYWPIGREKQSYPKLLAWWAGENTKGRHLWPGNFTSRYPADEIVEQIKVTRSQIREPGNVHFSMKAIMRNAGGIADALAKAYAEPAVVPASPWLGREPGTQVAAQHRRYERDGRTETVIVALNGPIRVFVVRGQIDGTWTVRLAQTGDGALPVSNLFPKKPTKLLVSGVDRYGRETEAVEVRQ
jgi:uncharacterized lipoprotein YddW (UPF0748 family)